jgi:hypothetical protein
MRRQPSLGSGGLGRGLERAAFAQVFHVVFDAGAFTLEEALDRIGKRRDAPASGRWWS